VKHLAAGAESSADKSPGTAASVSKAGAKAVDKAETVRAACESGHQLDMKWADLESALHTFRKTLREHVAAVTGEPAYVNGWHLPG
jgi:hypothetical protein